MSDRALLANDVKQVYIYNNYTKLSQLDLNSPLSPITTYLDFGRT